MSSSTTPAPHGHSQACCKLPPIQAEGYQEKGTYEQIGGYKTYVTGPDDAKKAILVVYDIFGYFPQTLQGADILATSHETKYKVLLPDWFDGKPCPLEWYPPDTEEKKKNIYGWISNWSAQKGSSLVSEYIKDAQARFPDVEWALHGHCWGGKVTTLTVSNPASVFKVASTSHPAFIDPKDAESVLVPFCMLASKDEDAKDVEAFGEALKVPKHVEIFDTQIHGWMSARSNLADETVRQEYVRGYQTLLQFYADHF